MQKVFISYDSNDSKWVDDFVENMKVKLPDIEIAYDKQRIQFGDEILQFIEESLKTSDIYMPIISKKYLKNQSIAKYEFDQMIKERIAEKKKLIPIFIENVPLNELPIVIKYVRSFYSFKLDHSIDELKKAIISQTDFKKDIRNERIVKKLKIQMSTDCSQSCQWCNNDEFELNNNSASIIKIIQNLVSPKDNIDIFPQLDMQFVFTGKEPLCEKDRLIEILNIIKYGMFNKSILLTNARYLNKDTAKNLYDSGLKTICINYNNLQNEFYRNMIKINGESAYSYFDIICENIIALRQFKFKVIISHVLVTGSPLNEIDSVIKELLELSDKTIDEFIFVQQRNAKNDIFDIGKKWSDSKSNLKEPEKLLTEHKYIYNNLNIRFTKYYCDSHNEDSETTIRRCLQCVGEKEIPISIDGRIRLCDKFISFHETEYNYQHLDESNPMKGIISSIKSQYATAGFYGHFHKIIFQKRINRECLQSDINYERIQKALSFSQLFEEILETNQEKMEIIQLITLVLQNTYEISKKENLELNDKIAININLLVAIHLCVDQNMFSTSRSILVAGLPFRLLSLIWKNKDRVFYEDNKKEFLEITTWCIASVAYEKYSERVIEKCINLMTDSALVEKSCVLSYLMGCIRRQQKKDDDAQKLFLNAINISQQLIGSSVGIISFLNIPKEIHVESLRSIGAAFRRTNAEKSKEYFIKAGYFARKTKSRFNYAVAYSLGYYAMESYFSTEKKEDFFNAHRSFFESLQQNPSNPIALIRMGLLEMANEEFRVCVEKFENARSAYKEKGLLNDLEYINFWLNEIMIDTVYKISDKIDFQKRPQKIKSTPYVGEEISGYSNAGENDIECAKRDAGYLLKIAQNKRINVNNIHKFISDCELLLTNKKIPYSVVISLTEQCNAKCTGCFAPKSEEEIPFDKLKSILEILSKVGVKRVSFGGGEPTLYKDLFNAVDFAHSLNLITAISTNGIKLVKEEIDLSKYTGILDEIIIDYHSTNHKLSSKFSPYMDSDHIKEIEKVFEKIINNKWMQLKVASIMVKESVSDDALIKTGERLMEIGVKVWKVDQYFHVDVNGLTDDDNNKNKNDFSIDDDEYKKCLHTLKNNFYNLKIIGIGADFKRDQRNFVISPRGEAVVNYNSKNEIVGDFVNDYEKLFNDYHSFLPINNYQILS